MSSRHMKKKTLGPEMVSYSPSNSEAEIPAAGRLEGDNSQWTLVPNKKLGKVRNRS